MYIAEAESRRVVAHILQDGILGVCAGVEMLKALHDSKIETEFPVGVINWTK